MEPSAPCNLYIKIGPPKPTPPPAPPVPVDDWTDPFYPEEEAEELSTAEVPIVLDVRLPSSCPHSCVASACCSVLASSTSSPSRCCFTTCTSIVGVSCSAAAPSGSQALHASIHTLKVDLPLRSCSEQHGEGPSSLIYDSFRLLSAGAAALWGPRVAKA
jgi:hypothetical protein